MIFKIYYNIMFKAILTAAAVLAIQETYKNFQGDQEWLCSPDEADWEIQKIDKRPNDQYLQGRDEAKQIIWTAKQQNRKFRIKAKKTFPHWTWIYSIE